MTAAGKRLSRLERALARREPMQACIIIATDRAEADQRLEEMRAVGSVIPGHPLFVLTGVRRSEGFGAW